MSKQSYQQTWQYILEDSIGVPTSSTVPLRLPGFITGETPLDAKFNAMPFRSLKPSGVSDLRAIDSVQTTKHEYTWGITYVPLKRQSALAKYDFRHFFNMALNNSSSTGISGAWTYGTSIVTQTSYFTIYKQIENLNHQFNGNLINKIQMKCSLTNPVEITADGFATAATTGSLSRTSASSLTNAVPFMWSDCQIYFDGTLSTNCTAFDLTVSNNSEAQYRLGKKDPQLVKLGGRDIDLSVTLQYNQVDYVSAKNNTARAVTVRLNDATPVDIQFRGCKIDDHPIPSATDPKETLIHILRIKPQTMGFLS